MEKTSNIKVLEIKDSCEHDTFDLIDYFMEKKMVPFMAVVVPAYFGAHLIVFILRMLGIFN